MGKVSTIRRLVATRGLRSLLTAFSEQDLISRTASFVRYWTTQHDYASVGGVVVVFTQTVVVEGHRFEAPRHLVSDVLRCRMLFGRYERPERDLVRTHLDPSCPIIELGGGLGVVACLINRRLHDPERHVVVEANPQLLPVLEANRQRNSARFAILHGAIAYGRTTAALRFGADCLSTTAGDAEEGLRVPTFTLRDLFAQFPYDGCVLVCDIEGAEIDLVANDADVLQRHVSMLILEEHPQSTPAARRAAMFDALRDAGFRRCGQCGDSHVLRNELRSGDASQSHV